MLLGKKYRLFSILAILALILSISLVGCGTQTATPAKSPTAAPSSSAPAAVVPDTAFFNGKTIHFIVATAPGGGYDGYARLVAPYLQKYLPGSTVVVDNVPGAGHIIGATQVFNSKPDGLTIGTFNSGLIQQQIIGNKDLAIDLNKFTWLGQSTSETRVIIAGKKSPYQTFDAMMKSTTPVKFGSAGVGSESHTDGLIVGQIFKMPVKMIAGYNGSAADTGLLKGEIDALASSYDSERGFCDTGEASVVLQMGTKADPEIKAPWIGDLVKGNDAGLSLASALASTASIGKPIAAPPGLSPERTAALIDALKKAYADPELLAKSKSLQLPIIPAFGKDVQDAVKGALNQTPENVKILKEILSAK